MASRVRITVLAENTAQGWGMLAEHGLSYWIDWEGRRVLFDTGQGNVLTSNAQRLGIPLEQAEAVVLSHGHYDHSGGLAEALRANRSAALYFHPAAWEPKYARNRDGTSREIGVPLLSQDALRRTSRRVVPTMSPTLIAGSLMATGPVPRVTDFEDTGGPFFLDSACLKPDPLIDDQSLFFETGDGLVVLLGCAHSGVINTLRYVRQLAGEQPIRAVLGGMHLVGASAERIARTVQELERLQVRWLAPCHCTGMVATIALWNAFSGACGACHVGATFDFDGR